MPRPERLINFLLHVVLHIHFGALGKIYTENADGLSQICLRHTWQRAEVCMMSIGDSARMQLNLNLKLNAAWSGFFFKNSFWLEILYFWLQNYLVWLQMLAKFAGK
jgi:hypothetical protein